MQEDLFSFEKSFEKLEKILEKISSSQTPLEESLTLFEEANELIQMASIKLSQAEQRIEMLIKNREGTLQLDSQNRPLVEEFKRTTGSGVVR